MLVSACNKTHNLLKFFTIYRSFVSTQKSMVIDNHIVATL